jgi:hypothetical protein
MYEGYRGKNSNILNEKYPPKELTQKEKNIFYLQFCK